MKHWRWETIVGVLTGFSTSLISISFIRILQHVKSWLPRVHVSRSSRFAPPTLLKRALFLCVYTIVMGWLAIQYGRRLGVDSLL